MEKAKCRRPAMLVKLGNETQIQGTLKINLKADQKFARQRIPERAFLVLQSGIGDIYGSQKGVPFRMVITRELGTSRAVHPGLLVSTVLFVLKTHSSKTAQASNCSWAGYQELVSFAQHRTPLQAIFAIELSNELAETSAELHSSLEHSSSILLPSPLLSWNHSPKTFPSYSYSPLSITAITPNKPLALLTLVLLHASWRTQADTVY